MFGLCYLLLGLVIRSHTAFSQINNTHTLPEGGGPAHNEDFFDVVREEDIMTGNSINGRPGGEIFIEVTSSPRSCNVRVNGQMVFYRDKLDNKPPKTPYFNTHLRMDGIYAISIHPSSGRKTGESTGFGHQPNGAFYAMEEFLNNVQNGRIIVMCTLAESALGMDNHGERLFRALNSSYLPDVQVRSLVSLVAVKGGRVLAEGYTLNLDGLDPSHPGYPHRLTTSLPKLSEREAVCERFRAPEHSGRVEFCSEHDGYRGLCDCENPTPLHYPPKPFRDGTFFEFPVIILASNRPQYLFRCLTSLLPVRGLDLSRLVVFVDGEFSEVRRLLQLLGLNVHEHVVELTGIASQDVGTRIGYNYRYTMEKAFNMFPAADKLVLLEEDLEVSPDFLSYFQQTHHLLDIDVSLYCISAWNDHGYNHTVGDPAMLYRIGFLPGLGWMLKRSFFFDEVVAAWPGTWTHFDWDVLLRLPAIRRGRDCVIPDVPRTYHFGYTGKHVHAGMQHMFFYDHALNNDPDVKLKDVDRMVYPKYQQLLMELIRNATELDGSQTNSTSCKNIIPSDTKNQTYVMFLRVYGPDDMEPWAKMATCLNLWDLDTRGDHRGIWRFWYNGNHIITMGVPYSRLSGFAMTVKDNMAVFAGKRTAKMKLYGRWPPGLPREGEGDRKKRYRAAARAVNLDLDKISEITESTRKA